MGNQKQMRKNVNVTSFKMQMFAMWSFLLVAIIVFSVLYFCFYIPSKDNIIEDIKLEIKTTLYEPIKSDVKNIRQMKSSKIQKKSKETEVSKDDVEKSKSEIPKKSISEKEEEISNNYSNYDVPDSGTSEEEEISNNYSNYDVPNSDTSEEEEISNNYSNDIKIVKSSAGLEISESEIELMARSIYCETLDGTFEDSLAVAAVMVNVYKSQNNVTMYDLISGNQFANPDYGEIEEYNFYNADISEDHQYYQAAIMALEGADPTGGCKAFYMPSDPIDWDCWHESLEYRYTSPNGHRFFYYD